MKNRKKLEGMVYKILAEIPETRSDDYLLTYYVICGLLLEKDIGADLFADIMLNHVKYGLPSIESITRARRRIQAKNGFLRADEATEKTREDEEKEYIRVAREERGL